MEEYPTPNEDVIESNQFDSCVIQRLKQRAGPP